jgi:serine protease Do
MAVTEIEGMLKEVGARAGSAVVGVGRRWGQGSGVVVAPGRVVTNAHNVEGDEVTVVLPEGARASGKVVGTDVDADLAVIAVDDAASPLEWGDASSLGPGSLVVALANPGGRGLRVTHGYVSSTERSFRGPRRRRIGGSVEHTAPLVRGSSGGPIVDQQGRLLGINTNRLGDGFYLAIPADDTLRGRVEALARGESRTPLRLGVGLAPASVGRRLRRAVGLPEATGLLVRVVEEDSPAARAGIAPGDLIAEAAGRPVESADDLYDSLDDAEGTLALKLLRGVEEIEVTVRFGTEEAA